MRKQEVLQTVGKVYALTMVFVMLIIAMAGCAPSYSRKTYLTPAAEIPRVNVPASMRQRNWIGNQGYGSCTHAALITLLRWNGRDEIANAWGMSHGNGEGPWSLARQLDYSGVRYAYVTNGSVQFLEWAISTRRGCNITVKGGRHMVTLVHLDETHAAILDNNKTGSFIWMPRNTLISEWKSSKGWAIAPVYSPAAPLP
ncbi:hypothetical protein LCGC14_2052380 [marine sediment metagenome]|uniref:Peptidase C39-like domain-containing protein n=1 Tax=marine sediment metagenome TaxID=412755 RepID=A0A0F9ENK4_9ZZZZ